MTSRQIRGRSFSAADLETIQELLKRYSDRGRTFVSLQVCSALGWVQPNGWPKDRACRDVLRQLESEGLLSLPPLRSNPAGNKRRGQALKPPLEGEDTSDLVEVSSSDLYLSQVKGTADESRWNWFVNEYHYLGHRVSVGRSLKYLAFCGERLVAAFGISDPAWAVSARDRWLASQGIGRGEIRNCVVNNSRFVIAPWVRVPNLASRLLSMLTATVAQDWHAYYSIRPLLVETFVDTDRFSGACYRAANWVILGYSKGYRKSGAGHRNGQTKKALLVYPLDRKIAIAAEKLRRKGAGHGLPDGSTNPRVI